MSEKKATPGAGGNRYIPYEQRTGNQSIVYFTRDLSAAGLRKIYERVNGTITGKVGVKLHTGEKNGPNIIPREWVRELLEKDLPGASIIETNTYYQGDRYTTEAGCSLCRRPYSTSGPLRDKPIEKQKEKAGSFPGLFLAPKQGRGRLKIWGGAGPAVDDKPAVENNRRPFACLNSYFLLQWSQSKRLEGKHHGVSGAEHSKAAKETEDQPGRTGGTAGAKRAGSE